jgi:glycine hydroxymethyltransferase
MLFYNKIEKKAMHGEEHRMDITRKYDDEIARLCNKEAERQYETINLIASENYTHPAVLQATASMLTNKYAEGYPGKRYYAGCEYVDDIEAIAIQRCKTLFNAEHANVQPHAGSQANMAAYFGLLQPGDTIMGMSLATGGHLTHGHNVNFSGKYYNTVQYGVDADTEQLDYDEIEKLAHQSKPRLIIAGTSAYSRNIDFKRFADIAHDVGAYFFADIAHIAGLVAAGLHQSPVPFADCVTSTTHKTLRGPRGGIIMCKQKHQKAIDRAVMPGIQGGPLMHAIAAKAVAFRLAQQSGFADYQKQIVTNAQALATHFMSNGYRIVSGGTDNHLFIIDLRNKSITGRQAEIALEKAGITVSRSCIPNDPEKPWITSGIRLGTPALTSRGMTKYDMETVFHYINNALDNIHDEIKLKKLRTAVKQFMKNFDLP